MESPRLNLGAIYIPVAGVSLHHCMGEKANAEPSIGIYGEPIPSEVTSAHIDQMTGHGIGRVIYNFIGHPNARENTLEFLQSDLIDQVEIELLYAPYAFVETGTSLKEEVFPDHLPFLRDNFLAHDSNSTYDGRPVFSTWNIYSIVADEDRRDQMLAEFGGYEEFVDEMRSYLRLDGEDPFLVAGAGSLGRHLQFDNPSSRLIQQFDGLSTWFPGEVWHSDDVASWEEMYPAVEKDFIGSQEFAEEQEMEFIPSVIPGYDERGSPCRDRDRFLPRSQEYFRQLLELAGEYSTSDRINIGTWNDWTEGHQIEPGSFKGVDYGTDYLEIVREFQSK